MRILGMPRFFTILTALAVAGSLHLIYSDKIGSVCGLAIIILALVAWIFQQERHRKSS